MFHTYLKLEFNKPKYVGEGTKQRVLQPNHFKNTAEHTCTITLSTHVDKVGARLQEQGIISWLGIENLENIQPFFQAGTKQNWTKMGPQKGHKQSKETCERKRQSHIGERWWRTENEHTRAKECPGEGWWLGRLPNKKRRKHVKKTDI